MLRPEKMQRVRLISMKSVVRPLITELHQLGMVEIQRFNVEGFESGKTVEAYDRISTNLVRIRTIKSMLGISNGNPSEAEMDLEKALRLAEDFHIEDELRRKHSALEQINEETESINAKLSDLGRLEQFNIDFSKLESGALSFAVGAMPAKLFPAFSAVIKKCKSCKMESAPCRNDMIIVLAYPSDDAGPELALAKCAFTPIDISGFKTPQQSKAEFTSRLAVLQKEAAAAKKEISAMAEKYRDKVLLIDKVISHWADRTLVTKELAFGNQTAMLEGWIKASDYPSLESTLGTKFRERVLIEKIPPKGEPPVVLNNPRSTYPFQFLVELFSLPKSKEIDPTLILLITLPIIYGMMMGDVVYGLISLVVANWMMGKFKKGGLGYGVASVWRFSAVAGMIFGIVFDEWMGFHSYQFLELLQEWGIINLVSLGITGPLYVGFSRAHQTDLLIGISILMGLVHIAFGFLLGAINEWHHDRKHAMGKIAWIFIEIGGTLAVCGGMLGILPADPYTMLGAGIFGAATLAMLFAEGPMGVLEIPGLLGNVLSYARIAAVGLVGLLLAELINDTLVPHPEQGIVYALIMLPLLLLLHLFNTGLAMIECIVQGGRLNLVEFYGKFFHGGGRPFAPFSMHVKNR